MIQILLENPLMLLLMVAALGYPLGRIKVYGITLGVGAVLFVGLGFGMLHPDMKAPAIVYIMGQALFVYTVGLSAGPSFVSTFRRNGIMNNAIAGGVLIASAALCIALQRYLALKPGIAAGIFCGSLTASPALGGALESIRQTAPENLLETLLAEPVVGFSVAYPIGVIGLMLTINVCQKLWKVDYQAEYRILHKPEDRKSLVHCTIKVQRVAPPRHDRSETERFKQLRSDLQPGEARRPVLLRRTSHRAAARGPGHGGRAAAGDRKARRGARGTQEQGAPGARPDRV